MRRRPFGAELEPSGGVHFRVSSGRGGKSSRSCSRVALERASPCPFEPTRRGSTPVMWLRQRPARSTGSASTATAAIARPGLALPARRAARPVARWSTRPPSGGPTSGSAPFAIAGQVIYEMHVGTFTRGGHLARRRRPSCRALRGAGRDGARGDAGRRVPRPLRLGLRRRRPVRADAHSTARPTTCARFVDARPRARLGVILDVVYNHFGPRRQLPRASSPPTTSPTTTRTSGARRSTSTARARSPCASSSSPTPATGSTSSTSTACGSTPRRRSTTTRRAHRARRSVGAAARPPAAATIVVVAENEPQEIAPRAAGRARAATASTRCGTTTSTTRAMVALTGQAARPTTPTTAARRRSSISAVKYGYLYQGQRYSLAEAAPRARPALDLPRHALRHLPREPRPGGQLGRGRRAATS